MPRHLVRVVSNGVTTEAYAQTPTPIALAPNPNRAIELSAPVIVTSTLPDATQSTAYTVTLNVLGGLSPFTWSLRSGTLPAGLSLSSSGVISGTPTTFETATFVVAITDALSQTDTAQLTLAVVAPPSTPTYGSHVGDWMVQHGDQALTLPDDTYDAANVNLPGIVHAATAGLYGGWLVLAAANHLGAVVDLADLALQLKSTDQGGSNRRRQPRILWVGVKFVNGQIPCEWLEWMRFWYCEFTFPPAEWNSQYVAQYQPRHGGSSPPNLSTIDDNAVAAMANPFGTTVSGNFCDNFEFFFCDWQKVYDDGVFITACDQWLFRGCRWWDNYNHNIQYKNPDGSTRAHSDNIQADGGVTTLIVTNSSLTHVNLEATGAGSCTIHFNNFWMMAGENSGILGGNHYASNGVTVLHTLSGTIKGGQWCGMAQYQPSDQTNPRYDVNQYGTYTNGGVTLAWNDRIAYGENAIQVGNVVWKRTDGTTIDLLTANSEWFSYPSGVTQPGSATASPGLINPDLTDSPIRTLTNSVIANHASNPAMIDRATSGNAYGDWAAFFAASRTESCGTNSGQATVTDTSCVATDVGKLVSGSGIQAGSRIVEVNPGVSFVMSKPAQATASPLLTLKYGWP